MRVLIVEDELFSANYLKEMLEQLGYEVMGIVESAKEAYERCKAWSPDVVLLDIMLKGSISGAEIALKIGDDCPSTMIIFLTAYSDKEMVEYAVESGAFAYLLKPYRIEEIDATMRLAKVHLQYRIKEPTKVDLADGFVYDLHTRRLFFENREVDLSPKMQKLLHILCQRKNSFVSSNYLLKRIWQEPKNSEALRALIYRLKKLTSPNIIQSSIKKGYRIVTKQDN